jgi:Replication initiator protein, pSAM2
LCPECYDYSAAVVWNAHSPELWRRTTIGIRRHLDKVARQHGVMVRLSYAKVAEFQARGAVHFHAIFRLDGIDSATPARILPPVQITARQLAAVISHVASITGFATVTHPVKPCGWDITWGGQVDTRIVNVTAAGQITDTAVASYLAKYSTKSTEATGTLAVRITRGNLRLYGSPKSHQGRLIRTAWNLGRHSHEDFKALRRWAHMLGYRGHFATKSRRYSTTLRALRTARADWHRRRHLTEHRVSSGQQIVVRVPDLAWAGRGWRSTGDALLALSSAARAREHRRVAREELAVA